MISHGQRIQITALQRQDQAARPCGAAAFRNLIEGSEDQLDYRLRAVVDKYDLGQDAQKVAFLKEATDMVARLPGSAERAVYAMRVAELAGVSADAVTAEVAQRRKRLLSRAGREAERQQTRPSRVLGQTGKIRYADQASARAEEGIIRVLLLDPALMNDPGLPPAELFTSPELGHIYTEILGRLRQGGEVSPATLSAALSGEEMSLLIRLQNEPLAAANSERALRDYIQKLNECKELNNKPAGPEDLLALSEKLRERKGY